MTLRGRIYVSDVDDLRKLIMEEAHFSTYASIREAPKCMKRGIAEFVSRCLVCQQMKAEHQRPLGTFQPLPIPE